MHYNEYKPITVGQLITQLATLPPMMPIFGAGSHIANKYFFNGMTLDHSDVTPVLLLRFSSREEMIPPITASKEELEDWKREQARQMTYESHKETTPVDQYGKS